MCWRQEALLLRQPNGVWDDIGVEPLDEAARESAAALDRVRDRRTVSGTPAWWFGQPDAHELHHYDADTEPPVD